MEGAALREEREHERRLMVAHHGAAWTGAAYAGKLKQFSHYRKDRTQQPQTAEDMLGTLRYFKEMGAPMDIKRVN